MWGKRERSCLCLDLSVAAVPFRSPCIFLVLLLITFPLHLWTILRSRIIIIHICLVTLVPYRAEEKKNARFVARRASPVLDSFHLPAQLLLSLLDPPQPWRVALTLQRFSLSAKTGALGICGFRVNESKESVRRLPRDARLSDQWRGEDGTHLVRRE